MACPYSGKKSCREDSCENPNDEVLAPAPLRVQLVVLEFWPPDAEQRQKMISAARDNVCSGLKTWMRQTKEAGPPCIMLRRWDILKLHCCYSRQKQRLTSLMMFPGLHPCGWQLNWVMLTLSAYWLKLVHSKIKRQAMVQHP